MFWRFPTRPVWWVLAASFAFYVWSALVHLTFAPTTWTLLTWSLVTFEVAMATMFGWIVVSGFRRRRKNRHLIQLRRQLRQRIDKLPLGQVLFCEQQNTSVVVEKAKHWPFWISRVRLQIPLDPDDPWCPVHGQGTYATLRTFTIWNMSETVSRHSIVWDGDLPKTPSMFTFFKKERADDFLADKEELDQLILLLDDVKPFLHP